MYFSPQNGDLFRNFRDVSTNNTPKITFYCILLTNFPKISKKWSKIFKFRKKCSKNFRGAFVAVKNPFFQFFAPPPLVDGPPGAVIPSNTPDIYCSELLCVYGLMLLLEPQHNVAWAFTTLCKSFTGFSIIYFAMIQLKWYLRMILILVFLYKTETTRY